MCWAQEEQTGGVADVERHQVISEQTLGGDEGIEGGPAGFDGLPAVVDDPSRIRRGCLQ